MYKIETVIPYFDVQGFCDKDTEININSKNVKLINNKDEYDGVCFNYALNEYGYIGSCKNAYDILKKEYKQINIRQAKKGDIISYHEQLNNGRKRNKISKYNALHFAIIKETKGTLKSTVIKSKWCNDGVFETNLYDIPDCYGNAIVIWRRKEENNNGNHFDN